jgi:hypothetical protein
MRVLGLPILKFVGATSASIALVLLILAAIIAWRRMMSISGWIDVPAEVLASELYEHRNNIIRRTDWTVTFRYEVAGATHTSSASLGYMSNQPRRHRETAEKYAPGTRHIIACNPDDPAEIHFGPAFMQFLAPFVLGVLGLVFLVMGLVTFRIRL